MSRVDDFINAKGEGFDIYRSGVGLLSLKGVNRDRLYEDTISILDHDSKYSLVADGVDLAAGDGSGFKVYRVRGKDESYVLLRESERFPHAYVATSDRKVTKREVSHLSGLLEGSLGNGFAFHTPIVSRAKVPYFLGRLKGFFRSKPSLPSISI